MLRTALNTLQAALLWAAAVLIGFSILLMCWEIFTRYLFSITNDWGIEVIQGTGIAGLLLAGSCIVRMDTLLSSSFLLQKLQGRALAVAQLAHSLLNFFVFSVLCMSAFFQFERYVTLNLIAPSTLRMPFWVFYLPFVIAMVCAVLFAIEKLYDRARAIPATKLEPSKRGA